MKEYNWKASELFPGAYALLDREEILIENPGSTWIGYTTRESARDNCQHDDIDPIPITPEILERAGFERKKFTALDWTAYFEYGDFCLVMNNKNKENIYFEYYQNDDEWPAPKFFHHLQMRVFMDSDREILLTLKP